jgi:hypothetical protein
MASRALVGIAAVPHGGTAAKRLQDLKNAPRRFTASFGQPLSAVTSERSTAEGAARPCTVASALENRVLSAARLAMTQ